MEECIKKTDNGVYCIVRIKNQFSYTLIHKIIQNDVACTKAAYVICVQYI